MDLPDGAPPASRVFPGSFTGSRGLSGANRYYPVPAVLLQPVGPAAQDGAAQGRWIALAVGMARVLGWPDPLPRVHMHDADEGAGEVGEGGEPRTWLVLAAPADRLQTAMAVNEWAWAAAADPGAVHPLGPDPVAHFQALATADVQPALAALSAAAGDRALPLRADDRSLTLGEGAGSITYACSALPDPADVPWLRLHAVPKLLVTGSHGKTTVLRLLAAMAREAGLVPGLALSVGDDGADHAADEPDAPDAQAVLRDPAVTAVLLETPRRSLLQHGLVVKQALVVVVTNVSADVRGDQAQRTLDEHATSMLTVAHAVAAGGALVMNGDDAAVLRVALGLAHSSAPPWALFSRDHATPLLDAMRRHGGSTCAPRDGRLVLVAGGNEHDLGAIADMPLSLGGHAAQQVANLATAALAAALAGWPVDALRRVLLRFGAVPQDNPGCLERWAHRGATVLVDRAHHADSLAQLLKLAGALGARRVGLLLGQDGRRSDQALALVAQAAAGFKPDRVVITAVPAAAGAQAVDAREPGEVPLLLEQGLRAGGLSSRALRHEHDEEAAARALLSWAKPGDVVLLPLHTAAVRDRLLDVLSAPG